MYKIDGDLLVRMFKQGTYELNRNKTVVDALNVFPVPDGDTGTNMSLTMNSALNEMLKAKEITAKDIAKSIAKGSLMGARGNSGVILSQIFRGFSKGCEGKDELTSIDLALAFNGAKETAYKAVLKPVEGTILTVIRKVADKAMEYTEEEVPVDELMKVLINKANETLEKTPEYLDVLKQAGVVDAGGKGLICIMDGFYDAMMGKETDIGEVMNASSEGPAQAMINTDDIKFQYCTEFIVQGDNIDGPTLQAKIEGLGDSMVFVQDEDLIKVHIHTNNPGVALEHAVEVGDLLKIKIENMKEQHSNIIDGSHAHDEEKKAVERKDYAFIAVAIGEGISTILKDLGVDYIIEGGQTMNPSTEDILKAIDHVNAENIFILPNNSNIILAATQAQELSDENVYVIPSKSIPQGIASMIAFDTTGEPEENFEEMSEVLAEVKTIQVTYSVRDTQFNGMDIEKGDYLGVADGEIKSHGKDQMDVIMTTIENTIDEDSEILTLYYGEDVTEDAANELAEAIEEKFEELEVEVHCGKQPLYYYIFSVE